MAGILDSWLETKSRLMAQGYVPFGDPRGDIRKEDLKCATGCDLEPSVHQFRKGEDYRWFKVCGRCGRVEEL